VRKSKTNIEARLIPAIYVTSWINLQFTMGSKRIAVHHQASDPVQQKQPTAVSCPAKIGGSSRVVLKVI